MKQMWIWFGIVYGNLNALVLSVVLAAFWVDSPHGQAFCSSFSVDIGSCRVWILVLLISFFGTATVLSLRRLLAVRKSVSQKEE